MRRRFQPAPKHVKRRPAERHDRRENSLAAARHRGYPRSNLRPCREDLSDLPQHHREGRADTLQEFRTHIPLDICEVPTGTAVFEWNIPLEWNIHDACIKNGRGEKVVDFAKSNLHDMSYSVPVRQPMPLSELKARIYTVPD